jgi:uncharacterized protein YvpB
MKLEVPFYKQESKNDCGPTALQMVLEYLGKNHSRQELMNLVDSDKSGVTYTLGLAVAAAKLGFKVEFYSVCLGFNPSNYELEFYKKEADEASLSQQKIERLRKEACRLGIKMQEINLSLKEILSKISKDCIPIVLLDWSKIKGSSDYIGHFVPIVGYDEENIYVHNQGFLNTQAFLPIKRKIFEEARKAKGTDEDILFISKSG